MIQLLLLLLMMMMVVVVVAVVIGRQLTTFNRPSRVHVGARRDTMDNIVRPFHGKITGQLVNSVPYANNPNK